MTRPAAAIAPPEARRLSRPEFIALMGTIFATVAFSIDAMLPALPEIAQSLTPEAANRAQLVLTSFILGMGLGTFVAGPISDALGRKSVILIGAALYLVGSAMAFVANSLEWLLVSRLLQGLGAAGPRVVSLAMVRDLYAGRAMAQVVSYAMLVFTLFPAVAPLIGAAIIAGFGWRSIFLSFMLFSIVTVAWITIRQPETLPPEARRPLRLPSFMADLRETLANRQMQVSILVQTLVFSALFGVISSIQQVFDITYGKGESFPLWFALIALLAAPGGPVNGVLVMRVGMRRMISSALLGSGALSLLTFAVLASGAAGAAEFWVYFAWSVSVFVTAALTIGNLNALALEPLGHVAGMAASVMGGLATVGGAIGGAVLGQMFDGTATPLTLAMALCLLPGAAAMRWLMPRETLSPAA